MADRVSQVAVEVLQQYQGITHVGVSQVAVEVVQQHVVTATTPDRQVIYVGR